MDPVVERPSRIPEALWDALSRELKVLLYELCEENRQLRDEVRDLKARSNQNSSNSSLPPSSDRPWDKPQKRKKARGGKRGGQKGHAPHRRALIPPERVQNTQECYPPSCRHCGCDLPAGDSQDEAYRHQVVDLPEIVPEVTEYRLHSQTCPHCKKVTRAQVPAGVPRGNFGPRVGAFIAVMTMAYHLSKRQVKALLQTLLTVDLALGTVVNVQKQAAEALAEPVNEVHAALKLREVVYHDESRWPEAGKKGYVWATSSGPYAYYEIAQSRSGEVARNLLGGSKFNGYAVSDRYAGYTCYPMERRGVCHAHLERDYQKIVDRGEDVRPIGEGLLNLESEIFGAWHAFKDGRTDRITLQERLVEIAVPYEKLLLQGIQAEDSKVAGMCANIYAHWPALWNFGWVEGMEPTNNEAERDVRNLVVLRKKCYGTQSASGSLFVARMASVIETCRRQGRNILQFVTDAFTAHTRGDRPPSLLVATGSG